MLKFFKNLFGSGQAEGDASGNGYTTPFAPAQQGHVAQAEPVNPTQPAHYAAAPSAPGQQGYASSNGVRIPLHAIVAVLPLELKTRVQQSMVAGVFVTIPLGRVVAQLSIGAVRMSFGELRAACPNVFSPAADRDSLQIALPLNEILPQVNPAFLPRRPAQRQVQVPDDVTGPFGNDGFGVTFADTRTITGTPITASQASPEPLPEPPPVAPPPPAPMVPRAVQPPKPAPFAPPARGIQPAKPPTPPPQAPIFTPKPAPMAPKPAPIAPQPIAMKPPQAPIAPKPASFAPQSPAMRPPSAPIAPQPAMRPPSAPIAPQAPVAKTNVPTPPVPFRNPLAPTPTPPAPPATPSAPPPVRPAFPTARGVGGAPQTPAAPRLPSNGSNGNGNANQHPPSAPIPFNQFQRAPQQAQPAPQVPDEPVFFQRAPQPQQPPQPQQAPQFHQAPQFQPAPEEAPAPQPAPTAVPQPAASNGPEVCLDVPLAMLSESWPDVLRGEIEQSQLSHANLSLPLRVIEPALKQGRIVFPWKVLRSWIRPAVAPSASANDGMMLELPLSVIAPLFFTRQKETNAARQKIELDDNIPNLFFGFPQPDSPTEAEPEHSAPATQAASDTDVFTPAQKAKPAAGVPDTNFYVWGDSGEAPQVDETEFKRKNPSVGTEFLSRYATPNEIVSRAAAIEGVVGALVALPDGLMVASKLSADLNGDTLAAFLPHIFGKVSQCTKELRMGELNNLNFTVGNVPWKIYRVNSIFFAAFGRAGQPLPTAQLSALAAELDRKKQ